MENIKSKVWKEDYLVPDRYENHDTIIYEEESYQIRGAVYEVYWEMGCGFLEAV